jgi:Xaa-Pro dipeptidase
MMNEYRSRWERLDLICREKFDISLPKALRENQIDMWIHVVKLGNPDALALDLGVGVSVRCPHPSSGSTGYFIFTDRGGDRIERALLGGFAPQGDVYDIVGPEEDLGQFVAERDPKRIAVNMSGWVAVADGLSHTCYLRLVEALGEKYAQRLVSAEQVITDFRDRRVISEIVEYGQLGEATRQLIERALSNEVITPGVTTKEDVGWWMTEQLLARGIEPSYSRLSVPSLLYSESEEFEGYPGPRQHLFQRGDLFQLDFGFSFMNLGTDMKRTAYILKEGETTVPQGVQRAWDQGLKARQVLRENIKVGRTAEETLKIVGDAFEEAGFVFVNLIHNPGYSGGWDAVWDEALKIRGLRPDERDKTQVSIDCHCVGNTGDSQIEPGPAISGFRPGRGHLTIKPNHLFAFELFANSPIAEWGGDRVRFGLEDDAIVTEDGVQFLYPPNSRILLIG